MIVSTVKKCPIGGWLGYTGNGELIATIQPKDRKTGRYLIAWVNGPAHGKISYGVDWQDVNDKVSEYSRMVA